MEKLDIKNWWINIKNWRIWEKLGLCTLMQSWEKDYTEIDLIDKCIELVKNRKKTKIRVYWDDFEGIGGNNGFTCAFRRKKLFNIKMHNTGWEFRYGLIERAEPAYNKFKYYTSRTYLSKSKASSDVETKKLKELYELCKKTRDEMSEERASKRREEATKAERCFLNQSVRRLGWHM